MMNKNNKKETIANEQTKKKQNQIIPRFTSGKKREQTGLGDLKIKGQAETNSLSDTFGTRQNAEMKVNFDDLQSIGNSNFNFSSKASEMQAAESPVRQCKSQIDDIQDTELSQLPTGRSMIENNERPQGQ